MPTTTTAAWLPRKHGRLASVVVRLVATEVALRVSAGASQPARWL